MIRNSIALSTLFQKPSHLMSIRKSRNNPGINNQLLGGIKLMQKIACCLDYLNTPKKKDLDFNFQPTSFPKGGHYEVNVGCGAISLVF